MSRLIDADAAKEKLCTMCRWEGTSNCDECEHPIDDMPSIDAVPVVMCKDCKYRKNANCERFGINRYTQSNSYCSWAERKES